jgi:hypothetical protein
MRSMAMLSLIVLSSCAGRTPLPPAIERCLTMKDHLRCRGADGSHYSDPYPGKVVRECSPVSDLEARKNWEEVLKR